MRDGHVGSEETFGEMIRNENSRKDTARWIRERIQETDDENLCRL